LVAIRMECRSRQPPERTAQVVGRQSRDARHLIEVERLARTLGESDARTLDRVALPSGGLRNGPARAPERIGPVEHDAEELDHALLHVQRVQWRAGPEVVEQAPLREIGAGLARPMRVAERVLGSIEYSFVALQDRLEEYARLHREPLALVPLGAHLQARVLLSLVV